MSDSKADDLDENTKKKAKSLMDLLTGIKIKEPALDESANSGTENALGNVVKTVKGISDNIAEDPEDP
jgi:hypothetical protein